MLIKMKTLKKTLALAAAAACFPIFLPAVAAAEEGKFIDNPTFYVGAGAGMTFVDTGITTSGDASLDEEDIGFKIYGGVNLNKFLSLEAFYVDLGEATLTANPGSTISASGGSVTIPAGANLSINANGTAIGFAPIVGYDVTEMIRPYAKVGVARWDMDVDIAISAGGTSGTLNFSDSGTDIFFGAGMLVKPLDHVQFRVEFERYLMNDFDVDMFSANIQYTF